MNEKKLLLVVDMQNDFIDGSLGTPEAQAIVPKVCEKIKNWDGLVWFTKDTHDENYLSTQEGRNLPVKHCIIGTPGFAIADPVLEAWMSRPGAGYPSVYLKHGFGAKDLVAGGLASGDLKDYWHGWTANGDRITSVELIGLCTDICVISNAVLIKSFFPEMKISVDASCCAGVTPQSHKNALEAMKMLQIEIKNEEA